MPGNVSSQTAEEVWNRTVAQIPGLFERLLYLGGIRNAATGTYEHQGLILRFGEEVAQSAILRSHEQTFVAWLAQPLETRVSDLEFYFARQKLLPETAISHWTEVPPCGLMTPTTARDSERLLCSEDFTTILGLLRSRLGLQRPDPEDR